MKNHLKNIAISIVLIPSIVAVYSVCFIALIFFDDVWEIEL